MFQNYLGFVHTLIIGLFCYFSRSSNSSQPLTKCRRVFQALITVAIEELCQVADSLISPVRMGIARPTAPFPLVNASADAVHVRLLSFMYTCMYINLLF